MRLAMCFLFALFLPKNETPDPDPKRFAEAIAKFTEADQANPPAKGGIVFTGSSSIRRWDLATSFPKLKPLNRGFGGSHFRIATITLKKPSCAMSHPSWLSSMVATICGERNLPPKC